MSLFLPWNLERLSWVKSLAGPQIKNRGALPGNPAIRSYGPVAFRRHLAMGLALFW
jgi:hypothetical protein